MPTIDLHELANCFASQHPFSFGFLRRLNGVQVKSVRPGLASWFIFAVLCLSWLNGYAQTLFDDEQIQMAIKEAKSLADRKQATLDELARQVSVLTDDSVVNESQNPVENKRVEVAPGVIMEFCFIPSTMSDSWRKMGGGFRTFMMGSPFGEANRENNEKPHAVCLSQSFWLGKFEVTQKQWQSVMGDNPSTFKNPLYPVDNVSWDDCQRFIWKIQKKHQSSGKLVFRLPTEAEWEYACRAGSTGPYYADLPSIAWYRSDFSRDDPYSEGPHPIGTKAVNVWGLHDMIGNVWEWCSDWYATDYPSELIADPEGKEYGPSHVRRGGSWDNNLNKCRAAYRGYIIDNNSNRNFGFRIVMTLP